MESKSDGVMDIIGALLVDTSSVYPASRSNRLLPLDSDPDETALVFSTPF